MNATNRKAIEILKSKMTQDERIKLFKNIVYQNGNIKLSHNIYHFIYGTFDYARSTEGWDYWYNIYCRFTVDELYQKIDIK